VLVVGGLPQYSRPGSTASKDIAAARAQVEDAIAETMIYARTAKMPLAIEPLHPAYAADRACVNTTKQALDICRSSRTRTAAVRLALRWTSITSGGTRNCCRRFREPAKIACLAFHVCDWLVPTKDILNDRGMMGDGVIDIKIGASRRRGAGVWRLLRGRNLFQRLVGEADGRGVADLHRPASLGGVTKAYVNAKLRTWTAPARRTRRQDDFPMPRRIAASKARWRFIRTRGRTSDDYGRLASALLSVRRLAADDGRPRFRRS